MSSSPLQTTNQILYQYGQPSSPRQKSDPRSAPLSAQPTGPAFTRVPADQYCSEGSTARFDAVIDSPTRCSVKWMHNNKTLMASSRYRSYFDGRNACLIISALSQFDVGTFTLVAENRSGFSTCSAILQLSGRPRSFGKQVLTTAVAPVQLNQTRQASAIDNVDTTSYMPAAELDRLESSRIEQSLNTGGPPVDDRPIVNPQSIADLENRRLAAIRKYSSQHASPSYQVAASDLRSIRQAPSIRQAAAAHSVGVQRPPQLTDQSSSTVHSEDTYALPLDEDTMTVDTRPIINPEAFKYLNKPESSATSHTPMEPQSMVDDSCIVSPSAFQYLELPDKPSSRVPSESGVDTAPIVDPRLFRYLELPRQPLHTKGSAEAEIDTRPLVDLKAFQYIDSSLSHRPPHLVGAPRTPRASRQLDSRSVVDTSTLIDQKAFRHLELPLSAKPDITPEIDVTPMVPSDAFKYIEPRQSAPTSRRRQRRHVSPTIDQTSYIDTRLLASIEGQNFQRPELVKPGVDDTSYVPSMAFKNLEEIAKFTPGFPTESAVDSTPIINPNAFRYLEQKETYRVKDSRPEIDDRPYINISSLSALEGAGKNKTVVAEEREDGFPPRLEEQLKDIQVIEGSDIAFAVGFQASPIPEITWFKDGKPLQTSSRILFFTDISTKTVVLSIKKVSVSDSGRYRLLVHNRHGQVESTASLVVDEQASIDDQSFVPLDRIRDLETSSQPGIAERRGTGIGPELLKPHGSRERPLGEKEEAKDQQQPPVFLTGLANVTTAKEGDDVTLRAKVQAVPTAELSLLRAPNPPSSESSRISLTYDFVNHDATIVIRSCTIHDTGIYAILARNPYGVANTFTKVQILPVGEADVTSPATLELQNSSDAHLSEGDDASLDFIFSGCPIPSFTIFFKEREISASSRISLQTNLFEKKLILTIKCLRPGDEGGYQLRAMQNGHVTSISEFTIQVTPLENGVVTESRIKRASLDHLQKDKKSIGVNSGLRGKSRFERDLGKLKELESLPSPTEMVTFVEEETEQPSFQTNLHSVIALEGKQAAFRAQVNGKPFPEATWFKNGRQIDLSSRVFVHTDLRERLYALVIKDVRASDKGEYELVLSNAAGKVSQKAHLTVKGDGVGNVDQRSYIDFNLIENLERQDALVSSTDESGVDRQSFVDADKFKYLTEGTIYPLDFQEDTRDHCAPVIERAVQSNVAVDDFSDIYLTCVLKRANPVPKVTWTKDGSDLSISSRVNVSANLATGLYSLRIGCAQLADAGLYQLTVGNYKGTVSCKCRVTVNASTTIDNSAMISSKSFEHIENRLDDPKSYEAGVDLAPFIPETAFRELEQLAKRLDKDCMEEVAEKLSIRKRQSDLKVKEGADIVLYALIKGTPIEKLEWSHNGRVIDASSRISMDIHLPTKTCWLIVSRAITKDVGIYNLIANNVCSSVNAQFYVDVQPEEGVESKALIHEDAFKGLESSGADQTLMVAEGVDSHGFIDYEKFEHLEHERMFQDTTGSAGVDRRSFVDPAKIQMLESIIESQRLNQQRSINDVSDDVKDGYSPVFQTKLPEAIDCKEGQYECVISVCVDGKPSPQVSWFKDGSKIDASSRIQSEYMPSAKRSSLRFLNVSLLDQGRYYVVAQNVHGLCTQSFTLNVLADLSIDQSRASLGKLSETDSSPAFVSKELHVNAKENEDMMTDLNVKCNCWCDVRVIKDGSEIKQSNRIDYFFDVVNQKCIFVIRDVTLADSGVYEYIVYNEHGRDACRLTISVCGQGDDWSQKDMKVFQALEAGAKPSVVDVSGEIDESSIVSDPLLSSRLVQDQRVQPHRVNLSSNEEAVEPLAFTIPLRNLSVNDQDSPIFWAKFTGHPTCVEWLYNGSALSAANRYQLAFQKNQASLKIDKCGLEDAGTYSLILLRPEGLGSCPSSTGTLSVTPRSEQTRDQTAFKALEERSQTEQAANREDIDATPLKVRSLTTKQCNTIEGQSLTLRALVQAGSPKQFHWLRDDHDLPMSSRYATVFDQQSSVISINMQSLTLSDKGVYSLRLEDELAGEKPLIVVITELLVQASSSIDMDSLLLDSTLKELSSLDSHPVSRKDQGHSGVDTTSYIPLEHFDKLTRPDRTQSTDENSVGIDSTSYIDLNAFAMVENSQLRGQIRPDVQPGIDETAYIHPEAFAQLEREAQTKPQDEELPAIEYSEDLLRLLDSTSTMSSKNLHFEEVHDTLDNSCRLGHIDDLAVAEGDDAVLRCSFQSVQPYKIIWCHNSVPISEDSHCWSQLDSALQISTLHLHTCRIEDSGTYAIHVMPLALSPLSSTSAFLTVIRSSSIDNQPVVESICKGMVSEDLQSIAAANSINAQVQQKMDQFASKMMEQRKSKPSEGILSVRNRPQLQDLQPLIESVSSSNPNPQEGSAISAVVLLRSSQDVAGVSWSINNRPATGSKRFMQLSKGNRYELVIQPVQISDTGIIKVKIHCRKRRGLEEAQLKLNVSPANEDYSTDLDRKLVRFALNLTYNEFESLKTKYKDWISSHPGNAEDLRQFQSGLLVPSPENDQSAIGTGSAFEFDTPPISGSTLEMSGIAFVFKLKGHFPEAKVNWFRNKVELKQSLFIKLIFDGMYGALLIGEVFADDAGQYRCVISNSGSEISCPFNLNVVKAA